MNNKLSADPIAMILGIISLVVTVAGCCCGLLHPVALALSIVGLVQANKSIREYYANPESYNANSLSNVNTGRVICIIGMAISGVLVLIFAAVFAIYGTLMSDEILKNYRDRNNETKMEQSDEAYIDSLYSIEEDTITTRTIDSINVQEEETTR